MMPIEQQPDISVIIPVYNAEKYLRRAIESLVYQTIENIEIICVNKGSTDSSREILEEYTKQFPKKVFVYDIGYTKTPSEGRHFGVEKAKGKYIYPCDADDMVRFQALEKLYEKAVIDDCDMVLGYNEILFPDGKRRSQGRLKGNRILTNQEAMLLNGAYWVRIIKKSLIDKVGNIPKGMYCDDFAYIPVITSYAQKIGYVDTLVYYYYRKAGSVMTIPNLEVVEGSINAEKWILKNVNPEEQQTAELVIGKHILVNLKARWQYNDRTIIWLKEFIEQLTPSSLLYKEQQPYNELMQWYKGAVGFIPKIVYINGFDEDFDENIYKNTYVFYDDFELIILNENNCDIHSTPWCCEAYNKKLYDFLGKYFALKMIYKTGGFYLGRRVIIDNPFNYLINLQVFFAYLDKENFTDEIWGASKQSSIIKTILDTYYEDPNIEFTLADRIKNILCIEYGLEVDGRTSMFKHPFSVFSPDIMAVNTSFNDSLDPVLQICHLDFSDCIGSNDYCCIKKSTLDYLTPCNESQFIKLKKNLQTKTEQLTTQAEFRNEISKLKQKERELQNLKDERKRLIAERKRIVAENDRLSEENKRLFYEHFHSKVEQGSNVSAQNELQQRLSEMEHSKSWRYTAFLRKVLWLLKRQN